VGKTPENEIVSTGSYIAIGSRAVIFEIATLEAHRRKGYAARIVHSLSGLHSPFLPSQILLLLKTGAGDHQSCTAEAWL